MPDKRKRAGCFCPHCGKKDGHKNGFRFIGAYQKRIQRYRCVSCDRVFTDEPKTIASQHQHKPWINKKMLHLLCSGVTQRRMAKIIGVTRNTVAKRLNYFAATAEQIHDSYLEKQELLSNLYQIDEMETFISNGNRKASIILVVTAGRWCSGLIVAAEVHAIGEAKNEADPQFQKEAAYQRALSKLEKTTTELSTLHVLCDGKKAYPEQLQKYFKDKKNLDLTVMHNTERIAAMKDFNKTHSGQHAHDVMFALNHVGAKIRRDLARMQRQTWATSKSYEWLQKHLHLYILYNNKYALKDKNFVARARKKKHQNIPMIQTAIMLKSSEIPTNKLAIPRQEQTAQK
jgi:transposase-like protein